MDWGEGEGGSIIELIVKLNNLTNKFDALKYLSGQICQLFSGHYIQ